MPPHFALPVEKKKKRKKTTSEGSFTWFETTVNGGAVVLSILRDASNFYSPSPQIGGVAKDLKADFRRLCEDAATLTVVIYESRLRSEDPDGWLGLGLKDAVNNLLIALNEIAEFAQAQVKRGRLVRVMNTAEDGNKITEFRERLNQAMNRFEVSAHLQSYELLSLMKKMTDDFQNRLNEQVARASTDDLSSLPKYENPEEQVVRDEERAKWLEQEQARKKQQPHQLNETDSIRGGHATSTLAFEAELQRMEEERARDAHMRALRSVIEEEVANGDLEQTEVGSLPTSQIAPRFGLSGGSEERKMEVEDSSAWFETTINGGDDILSILRDVANNPKAPYLRDVAMTTSTLIPLVNLDHSADFRRLCEDAATLTVVVYESRQRSEDPDGWPGPGLKEAVDSFLIALKEIAEFAQAQVERGRLIRVLNSAEDGNKIREFRERLAQAVARFEISTHRKSYEILRLMMNTVEDCKNRLSATPHESKEDVSKVPSDAESHEDPEDQVARGEERARSLSEEQAAKQEPRKQEQDVVEESEQTEVNSFPASPQALFGLSGGSGEGKKKKKGSITLFEITLAKDYRADFRRLCEDAANITIVVSESRQRSEDPDEWPGPGLKDPVDSLLATLCMIAEFAQSQVERGRVIRIMNSAEDGNRIREFRERLAQAVNRFELSAHLQSYELLRLMKNMIEDFQNNLNEQVATTRESMEDLPSLPAYEIPEEQVVRDEERANSLAEERAAKQEGRKMDQEAVNGEFRGRLTHAMNRFEVAAHLQSYELLRRMKSMIEGCKDHMNERVATLQESMEDLSSLPEYENPEEQPEPVVQDEERGKILEQEPAPKQDARKEELEAVNEKLQQILRMMESGPSFNVGHLDNRNGKLVIKIGGYTNYGQHAEGNGQIISHAPQTTNYGPVYAAGNGFNHPGMNDFTTARGSDSSYYQPDHFGSGDRDYYGRNPAATQGDQCVASTSQLAAAETELPSRPEIYMSPEVEAYLRRLIFSHNTEESSSEDIANLSLDDLGLQGSRFPENYERHTPDAVRKGKNVAHPPSIYDSDEDDLLDELEADRHSVEGKFQQYSSSYVYDVYNGNRVITKSVNSHDVNTIYSFNDSVLISRSLLGSSETLDRSIQ